MSSIQSVPGQPDAAPDSTPMHHCFSSPLTAARAVVLASSQVAGSPPCQLALL
jgi:hypothetical protein